MHEIDQGLTPSLCGHRNFGPGPMAFQSRDSQRSADLSLTKALPQVSLVLAGVGVSQPHEVAGAAADEQAGDGLDAAGGRFEDLLFDRVGQINSNPVRHHGPDLAQGERARDVEEIAHGARS
jgi:hypothetical protein